MSASSAELYQLQKRDVDAAGAALAAAFELDPIWSLLFEDVASSGSAMENWFRSPVRYCLKYGTVYAPSGKLEGIAAWTPSRYADMTFWRMIRSGAVRAGDMVNPTVMRLASRMQRIFTPLEADRKQLMAGSDYLYFQILGVHPAHQGQGFGGRLIRALIEESGRQGVSIYLETETERNAEMYEHFGFRTLQRISLPEIDLPMWQMAREPNATNKT